MPTRCETEYTVTRVFLDRPTPTANREAFMAAIIRDIIAPYAEDRRRKEAQS